MKNKNISGIILVFLFACLSSLLAQDNSKIPADFCQGRWVGNITGILRSYEPDHDEKHDYPFTIRLHGHSGYRSDVMKISASGPGSFTFVDSNATCGFTYYRGTFSIASNVLTNEIGTSLKGRTVMTFVGWLMAGMSAELENENTIKLEFITEGDDFTGSGKLFRINLERETIKINEPIKTDKYTQKDIVIPEVGKVEVKPESECKFKSKNELDLFKGKIRSRIKNLGKDALKIRSPQAVIAVRGTDFITIVGKNSTTLKVFEGKVAFSDINNEKTVIVKKNQMSTVKAGGVPSEPKKMDLASKWFSVH